MRRWNRHDTAIRASLLASIVTAVAAVPRSPCAENRTGEPRARRIVAGESTPRLDYVLRLDRLSRRAFDVTLRVSGLGGDSLVLHGVPAYMDNPTARARGGALHGVVARDSLGRALHVTPRRDARGEPLFLVRPAPDRLEVRYRLRADFTMSEQTRRYTIQNPYMNARRAWLYGNYLFVYPALARSRHHAVRVPVDIRVRLDLPPGMRRVALPEGELRLANVYELMSVQFGLGDFSTSTHLAGAETLQVAFRDSLEFAPGERAALRDFSVRALTAVAEFFGGERLGPFGILYYRSAGIGGQEGLTGCQNFLRARFDVTNHSDPQVRVFYGVVVHEIFHRWNPVWLFALEDPWIKEGVSCYYGHVLAARLGTMTDGDLDHVFDRYAKLVHSNRLFHTVALTDPEIWDREYDGEDWRTLTYERGMAATLLLDVLIRERTSNAHSLDDVLRALARDFGRGSYTHAELLQAIRDTTGVDAQGFFTTYVDGLACPSEEEVRQAMEKARDFGVFRPAPR